MDRAEHVRRILATTGLTLYRVSERSAQLFGRCSGFYLPHNLYSELADPSLSPSIQQTFALSRITNYRLSDWLAVFGFDLDLIPQLQLLAPRKRTVLLDSSVYDTQAWIPWFRGRRRNEPVPPIAPLTELLAPARPRRAGAFHRGRQGTFLYGKVGVSDLFAFPHLAPESIVRADSEYATELAFGDKTNSEASLYLIEHDTGWTCSQLVPLGKDRILLTSAQHPCAQRELKLGSEARILGLIDAELRPVRSRPYAWPPLLPARSATASRLRSPDWRATLKGLLRHSRLRAGLSYREASALSRWIAGRLSDDRYFAAASTLADYETLSEPPRHVQKLMTLCVLYSIEFLQLLLSCGLPVDQAGKEPMADELVGRPVLPAGDGPRVRGEEEKNDDQTGFLDSLVTQWKEIPLFVRNSLCGLTDLKQFALSDVFWTGGAQAPRHPSLTGAQFLIVNRRIKKIAEFRGLPFCEQPLYLLLKRDGSYLCGPCTLEDGHLIVPAYPGGQGEGQQFRSGLDAEVIGRVTTILRRFR